jgi:hypothetical protein
VVNYLRAHFVTGAVPYIPRTRVARRIHLRAASLLVAALELPELLTAVVELKPDVVVEVPTTVPVLLGVTASNGSPPV